MKKLPLSMNARMKAVLYLVVVLALAACTQPGGPPNPTEPPGAFALAAPAAFCMADDAGGVTISWSAAERAASYTVFRNGEQIAVLGGTTTTYRDEGSFEPGTQIEYSIRASNGIGVAQSAPVSASVPFGVCLQGKKMIASSSEFALAIAEDGTVWAWGSNNNGALGQGTYFLDFPGPVQVPFLSNVTAVAAGRSHALALDADGHVWAWGANFDAQLGLPLSVPEHTVPTMLSGLPPMIDIAAGEDHSLSVAADGSVWAWGRNSEGQAGADPDSNSQIGPPVRLESLTNVRSVHAGWSSSFAVHADGTVSAWGSNEGGVLGASGEPYHFEPRKVPDVESAVWVSASEDAAVALLETGSVVAWGNLPWENAPPPVIMTLNSAPAAVLELGNVSSISLNMHGVLAVLDDGTVVQGGGDWRVDEPQFDEDFPIWPPEPVPGITDARLVSTSHRFTVALTGSGEVLAWGVNRRGSLGEHMPRERYTLTELATSETFARIDASSSHVLAVTDQGDVYSWGYPDDRILANGAGADGVSRPKLVPGLDDIVDIAAGYRFSLAVDGSGSVYSWGNAEAGQLGHGDLTANWVAQPRLVTGLTGIVAVSAGNAHALALDDQGAVWAWGLNSDGQTGTGSPEDFVAAPTQVSLPADAEQIAAGMSHSVAVLADGSVWSWGNGGYGALGRGGATGASASDESEPVLSQATGVRAVAAGADFTVAIQADGTAVAWGRGANGRLGTGTTSNSSVPLAVVGLEDLTFVTADDDHVLAVDTSGALFGWGRDGGALGSRSESSDAPFSVSTPVRIESGAAPYLAAAGDGFSVVVLDGVAYATGMDDGGLGVGKLFFSVDPMLVDGLPRIAQPRN